MVWSAHLKAFLANRSNISLTLMCFGLMEVTRAFIPHFRTKRSGVIMNVSSIGGRITFPLISMYLSTKRAVEGFSESVSADISLNRFMT